MKNLNIKGFKVVTFKNAREFSEYLRSNQPKEIWLGAFSETEPYLIQLKYTEKSISGVFNHTSLFNAELTNMFWLFEIGMYVKISQ